MKCFGRLTRPLTLGVILGLAGCSGPPKAESVRAELARLQRETGLTVAKFDNHSVETVGFADRSHLAEPRLPLQDPLGPASISPSGKQIALEASGVGMHDLHYDTFAIIKRDGSGHREFPRLYPANGICWSPDETKIAISNTAGIAILTLDSGSVHQVDGHARTTSQCWSPNGKQFVYWVHDDVRVYDADQDRTRSIAKGTHPTWSPDGKSIAFLDNDAYFAVCPTGGEPKPLFEPKSALSGLWWSPDSRIVAYLTREPLFGSAPWLRDFDVARLRVRRLSDGSDDWVEDIVYYYNLNYQWIISPGSAISH
jgi:WD40-like Beta Propeller Repeat